MIYPCDYGHDHRSAAAKRRCEERNDSRGVPASARLARSSKPAPAPADQPKTLADLGLVDWSEWRS